MPSVHTEPTPLNSAQRAAVEHSGGAVLVLAGAGSGKTRVLTERVARLLREGAASETILSFTFTNRAAREMRERIAAAVGPSAGRLWLGTFHGVGLRILRREARSFQEVSGRGPDFVVYDREDQEGAVREVLRAMGAPEDLGGPADLLRRVSDAKNALVTPAEAERAAVTSVERRRAHAYRLYQQMLRRRNAVDFDDLIAETVWLFRVRAEVAAGYAARFVHVLVDEYQDTNHSQFRLVETLGRGHGNVFVVGDDDQSIYGWRGADLRNVLDFERAFPGAAVVRLEQNYRSTGNILAAANAVIACNRARKGKRLWCEGQAGTPLRFVLAQDEREEARRIAGFVERRTSRPGGAGRLADCAVLYRTHAQSRALETELRHRGISYEVVGGVSFYQRREIKDLLAYLRLAVNPADEAAFWRVLNTPARGLGAVARARIAERLAGGAPDPLEALRALLREGGLGRGARPAAELLQLLDELRARRAERADALLVAVLERTEYLRHLGEEGGPEGIERQTNVQELVSSSAVFSEGNPESGLAGYLAEAALLTDVDRLEEGADRLLLLTAHNAKGLEFSAVVIAGLEEGLFPHASALENAAELEEERRLFYVALTRAREEVLLTAAAFRHRYTAGGGYAVAGGRLSRFVEEIPDHLLLREEVPGLERATGRSRGWPRRGGRDRPGRGTDTRPPTGEGVAGREVFHATFGRGIVMGVEGGDGDRRFTVRFGTRVKKVLGRFLSEERDVD